MHGLNVAFFDVVSFKKEFYGRHMHSSSGTAIAHMKASCNQLPNQQKMPLIDLNANAKAIVNIKSICYVIE